MRELNSYICHNTLGDMLPKSPATATDVLACCSIAARLHHFKSVAPIGRPLADGSGSTTNLDPAGFRVPLVPDSACLVFETR